MTFNFQLQIVLKKSTNQNRKMKKIIITLAVLVSGITSGFAQDAEGCKDHPLFSRMPGYYISECTGNYNKLDFYTRNGEDTIVEGELSYAWYVFNTESGLTEPSYLQIVRNYSNAVSKAGGRKIYEYDGLGCFELKKNGKIYLIKVACTNNSDILLYIAEIEPMKQEITANEMLDALNKDGFISLDILFDTGKSTIKSESRSIIAQVDELMKMDPALKISIEGHTDNVGDAAANKKLSTDRAKAVADALSALGIDKSRLSYVGWGQEKPVADNRTDDGRAKNRRVEIVKKS
jgi:OmpA-OmpF porin, OOP family